MLTEDVRKKLQHIIQGTVIQAAQDHCTATRNFLCSGFRTSKTDKREFEGQLLVKKEQAKRLTEFASQKNFWVSNLQDPNLFLAEGGEAKVYLDGDRRSVIKVNDAGYYATWLELF